ncbi:MAG: TraR/DksA C4-type zinc finger protein [Planctomycetes bacterium]|nr:TraR/DksA C4-type zinc finger protein [Planctomycetota bacterium]
MKKSSTSGDKAKPPVPKSTAGEIRRSEPAPRGEPATKAAAHPVAKVQPPAGSPRRADKKSAAGEGSSPAGAGRGEPASGKAGAATSPRPARGKKNLLPPRPPVKLNRAGQVAGVLQAARSVASKATKIVETTKERKSHLTAEELAEFRQILLDKRRELVEDMVNLEGEAKRSGGEGGALSGTMPIHMADLGTDTWEQEFTLNLIEKERTIVREIDEALDRIEKKTYGTCLATGRPISKARLRVKPWAKYCIEYARKRELGLT